MTPHPGPAPSVPGRFLIHSRFYTLVFLVLFPLALSGCSLLFVVQGKTHIASTPVEPTPQAASLEKKMSREVVLHYKVQEGDTLDLIAEAFYGKDFPKKKLARRNHLDPNKPLKPGLVLKIAKPFNFPSKDDLDQRRKALVERAQSTATPGPTWTPVLAFSEPDTEEDEKDIEKIPRPKANRAFAPGEKLTYEVRAIGVLGGYATLSVENSQDVHHRPCYPLMARAKSAFPFSTFYPVNDVQTSYFDSVDFLTWKFENDVHEGNYKARNREDYDQIQHTVTRQHNQEPTETDDIQPFTQDIISCLYYFRLLPLQEGKKYMVPTCSLGKNYKMICKVLSREKITCPAGTFDCLHAKPFVKYGTVFRNKEDIDLWLTADDRHIPVLIKSAIVIGSIEVSLLDATVPDINGDGGKMASRVSQ